MTEGGRQIREVPNLGFKRIYDDFHGLIPLTKKEIEIIDSPLFQRLRNIKQLGLAGFVFPGATHNRFSHSLGVLSILQRLVRQLDYFDDKPKEVEKLRVAALLHDVGHLPLSHTIESVYRWEEKKKEKELEGDPVSRDIDESITERPTINGAPGKGAFHERLGQFVIENTAFDDGITKLLKELNFEPGEIGSMIVGSHPIPLFNQLINSDLDADQMDYLLRDAKNVGINYGSYETDYLISCMRCSNDPKKLILYLSKKGLNPAEYYLLAKYYYYTQILYHSKREIYEIIASVLFQIAQEFGLAPKVDELFELVKNEPTFFITFDDIWFIKAVDEISSCTKVLKEFPWVARFAYCIRFRRHKEIIKLKREEIHIVEKEGEEEKELMARTRNEGYIEFASIDDIKGRSSLRKFVDVDIAESGEAINKTYDFEKPELHSDHILIDIDGHLTPINICQSSLVESLSRQRVLILREYELNIT